MNTCRISNLCTSWIAQAMHYEYDNPELAWRCAVHSFTSCIEIQYPELRPNNNNIFY